MKHISETPKWWLDLARFSLYVTLGVVLIGTMSILFAITGLFSTYDFAGLFTYGIIFVLSWYVSLGLALLAIIGVVMGYFLKYPLKQYVMMFILSLIPTLLFDVVR